MSEIPVWNLQRGPRPPPGWYRANKKTRPRARRSAFTLAELEHALVAARDGLLDELPLRLGRERAHRLVEVLDQGQQAVAVERLRVVAPSDREPCARRDDLQERLRR